MGAWDSFRGGGGEVEQLGHKSDHLLPISAMDCVVKYISYLFLEVPILWNIVLQHTTVAFKD